MDRFLEVRDAAEGPATEPFFRQFAEPALDQVEPGGTRRGEVEPEPGMRTKPGLDRLVSVSPLVIDDEV